MEELKIQLAYDPEHFKEIYYQNGQGSLLTYKPTRNAIAIPGALLLITAVIYFLSFKFPGISWLIGLGLIAAFSTGVYAVITIIKYRKWKMGIKSFLKELSQYKSFSLSLTENAIEVVLDSSTTIDKWDNLRSARIEKNYILLDNEKGALYFFPAKSMKQEEFEKLKEFVRIKIK